MLKVKKPVIVLIILSLVLALLLGGKVPYLIFYMISGVFIISYLWTAYVYNKIMGFQRVDDNEYYVGDAIKILSYIDNDTLLPIPYVEILDHTTEGMGDISPRPTIVSMMPTERELVESSLNIKFRGLYDIGPLELKVSDVFGAFTWNKKVSTNNFIKVYPRVYTIEKFNLKSMQAFGTMSTTNKAHEDNTSISDIRKYSLGDSVKKIHWKVTAKKGTLHVKNYEMTGSASVYIILDLKNNCYGGENSKLLEEKAVETAASLSGYFLSNAVSVNMYVSSSKLYYAKGRDMDELKNFLEVLCEVGSGGYSSVRELLEKRIRLIAKGSSLIIITGNVDNDDAKVSSAVKNLGYDIVQIIVKDEEIKSETKNILINSEIKTYFITSQSNIKEVLESR